jgi:hypothetical protein
MLILARMQGRQYSTPRLGFELSRGSSVLCFLIKGQPAVKSAFLKSRISPWTHFRKSRRAESLSIKQGGVLRG